MKTIAILILAILVNAAAQENWERIGFVRGQEKKPTEAEVLQQQFRAKQAAEEAAAKAKADLLAIQQNPANYRMVTGQVFNIILSKLWRSVPDQNRQLRFESDFQGLQIFKEGGRTIAVTNYTGPVPLEYDSKFKPFRALLVGEIKYNGKRTQLLDCGTMPPIGALSTTNATASR